MAAPGSALRSARESGTRSRLSPDADYLLRDLLAAEPWHFWFRARRDLLLWALGHHFPEARRLLEIGCGTGFVLDGLRQRAPGLSLVGCDRLVEAIHCAKERLRGVPLILGDVLHLPVRESFDAVVALDVIEHLDDDERALHEMFRVLSPGGGLIVSVPQHPWLWSQIDEFSCHRRRYNRSDLLGKLRAAGFQVIRCTSIFSAILPLMMMARFHRRRRGFDPVAELRIPRVASAAAFALLQPEWFLIRAGVSMPFGGSLLAVARRPAVR